MDFNVVVCGRNRRIAADICDHLKKDRGISAKKSASTKSALLELALHETPHMVIVCLGDESTEEIKVYDVLKDCEKVGLTTIIVIGNETDRKHFMTESAVGRIYFLSRPVSLLALYTKIDEVKRNINDDTINALSLFTEFINPNANKEFERKHILVVDDDPEQLYQIKEHLKEFYDVTAVASGAAAFRYMERFKVDLILLDFIMPDMDGPEVFKQLRSMPILKDIPVVFLTGVSDRDKVKMVLVDLGPQGYILKPTKKSELVAKIIDVLG